MTKEYKKILIVRTDRIGDVLLSTPAIKAVREAYPASHIAAMVRPYAREILEGNPSIDELIIYDKYGAHKGLLASFRFALLLKKKKFDLALILHPTNRVHIMCFLAGIPARAGFNKKFGLLLTRRVKDRKRQGKRHEAEYTMDILRAVNIEPGEKKLYIPVSEKYRSSMDRFLKAAGISDGENVVAIHPGASCPSKIWPKENFAKLADRLVQNFGVKTVLVSGESDTHICQDIERLMMEKPLSLAGRTTLRELTALLERCALFISNDSGPVHIAVAVGTPVIDIFGRSDPGLSPKRWGPLGERDIVFHKDVGCKKCFAHNCNKGFRCLSGISVDEVLRAAEKILADGITINPKF